MKAVVQRVKRGRVTVSGEAVGHCGQGYVVLVAAARDDTDSNAAKMADRIVGMRVFNDADGRINLNLADFEALQGTQPTQPNILAVSNFTVYGDASQRRPSFGAAAPYAHGQRLFDVFVAELERLGARVSTGEFGADMDVELVNDGPVTLVVEA